MLLLTNQLIDTGEMSIIRISLSLITTVISFHTDEETRVQSGQLLESNIKARFRHFPVELVDFLKNECLSALDDPSPTIRATVLTLIETILVKLGKFSNWPDILPKLNQLLDSSENSDLEGVFRALQSSQEDFSSGLYLSSVGLQNELISKLLQFSSHISPKIRLLPIIIDIDALFYK